MRHRHRSAAWSRFQVVGLSAVAAAALGCAARVSAQGRGRISATQQAGALSEQPRAPEATVCEAAPAPPSGWLEAGPLLVGEVHGTVETPMVALALACEAAREGRPVQLALELPHTEAEAIEGYLSSGTTEELLSSPHWTADYQDGRSSEAFLKLLTEVRRLRRAGIPIEPFTFDDDPKAPSKDRDLSMAQRIEARWRSRGGPMIVLVGNIHAKTAVALPRPAGFHLTRLGLVPRALLVEAQQGEAWLCTTRSPESCGRHRVGMMSRGRVRLGEITLGVAGVRGYDARLILPTFTASPPAVRASAPSAPPR